MSFFEAAIPVVLKHEGWGRFVQHPADPGGATKWGISLRFLREQGTAGDVDGDGDVDADDVRKLTRDQAEHFYRCRFWDLNSYSILVDQDVATKVFDTCVNTGPKPAHKILQRALRACGSQLLDDGELGPKTLTAANAVPPVQLLIGLRCEQAGYYRELIARNAAREAFRTGWLNRAYS